MPESDLVLLQTAPQSMWSWGPWGGGSAQECAEVGGEASQPQEGAQEQGLRGLGNKLTRLPGSFPCLSETANGLVACGADGGLSTQGGKLLDRARARVVPREIRQWGPIKIRQAG